MKKSLVLMAMAGVALASCVNNEVVDVPQKEQEKALIRFDAPVTYTNGSRANYYGEIGAHTYGGGSSAETFTYPWGENFIVYAVKHSGNLTSWDAETNQKFWKIGDQEKDFILVKSDERFNGWSPATIQQVTVDGNQTINYTFVDHHWPQGELLSFAAYSPANLEMPEGYNEKDISYGSTGLIIKNFQVQGTSKKQYDLMFSKRVCNKSGHTENTTSSQGGISYYNGIPIEFQHALSSIHFALKNSSNKIVKLKNIKVYGVKFKGHFFENIIRETAEYARGQSVKPRWSFWQLDEQGKEIENMEMTNITIPAPVEGQADKSSYVAFKGEVTFPATAEHVSSIFGKYVASENSAGRVVDPENNYAYALLLLPQELTDEAFVEVTFTVQNADGTNPQTYTHPYQLNKFSETSSDGTSSVITEWEIGTRYTYQLLYSEESVADDLIYFAPQTDNWKDVTPIVITL